MIFAARLPKSSIMDKYRYLERREFKIGSIVLKFKKLLDSFPHKKPLNSK